LLQFQPAVARGPVLEGAEADEAGGDAGDHGGRLSFLAADRYIGADHAQRPGGRDAEAGHRLRAEEFADRRAQHGAAVGAARVGRAARSLELDFPMAARVAQAAQQVRPAVRSAPAQSPVQRVWVDSHAAQADALKSLVARAGLSMVNRGPDADLCVVQPWGMDATSMALSLGLDPARTVAVDPITPFDLRRTLMLTAVTTAAARDGAHALLGSDGVPVTVINDSGGFIAQRVMATIVNIAANIAQRGIASVADLEDSVKLGLGYPHGPLTWGDRIGPARILAILRAQQDSTGDPRYRPSPWLMRRVALGLPLTTPEAMR